MRVIVPLSQIIAALEGVAGNTDTDPRWLAATELRRYQHWETSAVECDVDGDVE